MISVQQLIDGGIHDAVLGEGADMIREDVNLGDDFVPRAVRLRFWCVGKATAILVPNSITYRGDDVRLSRTGEIDGWKTLHVGPASLVECAKEFLDLVQGRPVKPAPPKAVGERQDAARSLLAGNLQRASEGVRASNRPPHGSLAKFKVGDLVRHRQTPSLVFQVVEILEPIPLREGDHLLACALGSDIHKYHEQDLEPAGRQRRHKDTKSAGSKTP